MSFQASFKQILEEKMAKKTPFTSGNEASQAPTDPAHLAYLLGQINRLEVSTSRKHYPTAKMRPQRKAHSFSTAQKLSYEFLKTWIQDLSEGFTANELKTAFRQAALILHPDQGGNVQQFLELKDHYAILRALVSK